MDYTIRDDDRYLTACLKLAALTGISLTDRRRLLENYPDPLSIFSAPTEQIRTQLGLSHERVRKALDRIDQARLEKQLEQLKKHRIHALPVNHPAYPTRLKHVDDAPPVLFVRGDVELLSGPQLAMVGSRNASPLGLHTAHAFATELARSGLTITSGLASGIDTAAHKGALGEIGRTVAVVATGLDAVYPKTNLALAREIVNEGCMASEFPPLTPARREHFPQRNRIISGLSLGVLVVEADTRSGSLITARLAGEQGREIFAIPGSIHSPTSRGCHQLIRQGAKLVETTGDVLVELRTQLTAELKNSPPPPLKQPASKKNLDPSEKKVLNHVDFAPTRLEDIAVHSNLSVELVLSTLLQLELAGRIAPLPGGRYQRIPD